jgi:hypothetical protein
VGEPVGDAAGCGDVFAEGVALAEALGRGFGVRVTTLAAAWVTSNCTSVGVDPRAAAYTW